jgi:putative phage-type endonuclease
MKLINVKQGTLEWHHHRASHYNASDAAAMMGVSPYKTRIQLLDEYTAGIAKEMWAVLADKGHKFEDLMRPWAEMMTGVEFKPLVGALDDDQLQEFGGLPLSASFDGITLTYTDVYEHKTLNKELVEAMDEHFIPHHYQYQLEQQLLVSGADRVFFVASNGDEESARYTVYVSNPELRAKLIAGWKQFHIDRQHHVPTVQPAAPVGRAPELLPALRVELSGTVVASNLAEFKEHALAVFNGINKDLQTDDDFANAKKTVKWCADVEAKLKLVKEQAQAQMVDVDAVFRAIDEIAKASSQTRLVLDKLVTTEEAKRKLELIAEAKKEIADHILLLNNQLGGLYIRDVAADFAAAVKGTRLISSAKERLAATLAVAKVDAALEFNKIELNLKSYKEIANDYDCLFPDLITIVTKANDDFTALVKLRISDHKLAEQKRNEELAHQVPNTPLEKLAPATAHQPNEIISAVVEQMRSMTKEEQLKVLNFVNAVVLPKAA